ncbi:MAG: TolC family protein [Gelidibacter sp.]
MRKLRWSTGVIAALLSINSISAQEVLTKKVTLQNLYELADKNNNTLQILTNQEEIAEYALKEEKQKLLPSINATLMASYNGDGYITDRDFSNGFSVPIPEFGNNFIVEAQQLIYAGKAAKTSIEMAKNQKNS